MCIYIYICICIDLFICIYLFVYLYVFIYIQSLWRAAGASRRRASGPGRSPRRRCRPTASRSAARTSARPEYDRIADAGRLHRRYTSGGRRYSIEPMRMACGRPDVASDSQTEVYVLKSCAQLIIGQNTEPRPRLGGGEVTRSGVLQHATALNSPRQHTMSSAYLVT